MKDSFGLVFTLTVIIEWSDSAILIRLSGVETIYCYGTCKNQSFDIVFIKGIDDVLGATDINIIV